MEKKNITTISSNKFTIMTVIIIIYIDKRLSVQPRVVVFSGNTDKTRHQLKSAK